MTSLEKTVEITRRVLIGFFIGLGSIVFIFILLTIISSIRNIFFPTPQPPPTVSFGKLPAISYETTGLKNTFNYTLETNTGNLPNLPDRENVYKINNPTPNFLNLSDATNIASQNNFTSSPIAISDIVYKWTTSTPSSSLTMNIVDNNFNYSYNFLSDQNVIQAVNLPNTTAAIQTATNFFSQYITKLPSDIDTTNAPTTLLMINNSNIIPAPSFSQTQIIRVDFYQNNVNNLPIYYPNFPNSLLYAYVGGGANNPQVLKASYFYKNISTTNSTYPIKTAAQAFDELKKGGGYISSSYNGNSKNINIRSVNLGYILYSDAQNYLMPVIVFKGDNNFYAFISAVTDQWISN